MNSAERRRRTREALLEAAALEFETQGTALAMRLAHRTCHIEPTRFPTYFSKTSADDSHRSA